MNIHNNFTGGNIEVLSVDSNVIHLTNQLRDTQGDWFYWAFCIEGAQGQTLTFCFTNNRIGYFGPAVSHDLENWKWLDELDGDHSFSIDTPAGDSFTYTFGPKETKVYFAHNMLYHPKRFEAFAAAHELPLQTLCQSPKVRPVPYVSFGQGSRTILLTARHHACESTGDYVLEGVLTGLLKHPIPDTRVICVPFVDYDGVVDGDQGKNRAPYDHNRDYRVGEPAIYPETGAIRKLAEENDLVLGIDFHSPWHKGGNNDWVYIVQNNPKKLPLLNRLGLLFESSMTEGALQYRKSNDYPPNTGWNVEGTPCFGSYMHNYGGAGLSFSLETTYFGEPDNRFSQNGAVQMGQCLAAAIARYLDDSVKITITGDLMCHASMTQLDPSVYPQFFAQAKEELLDTDYLIGNLETPIAGKQMQYTFERYCFNTPEAYLDAMKDCHFHLLTLANNHCMDRGEEGIRKTLQNCRDCGFETLGIYDSKESRDSVFIKELGGIRVAFVNYTYGTNAFAHHRYLTHPYMVNLLQPEEEKTGSIHLLHSNEQIGKETQALYFEQNSTYELHIKPYLDQLKNDITRAKAQADYVIMLLHCGGQHNALVDPYTQYIAAQIKSYGADVIIGHHPHIIQSSTVQDGFLTVYCLGNFICSPEDMSGHEVDPTYNALMNLYLRRQDGKVRLTAGFRLFQTVVGSDGVPFAINTYKLYQQKPSAAFRSQILHYANLFAGITGENPAQAPYTQVQNEYFIDLGKDR